MNHSHNITYHLVTHFGARFRAVLVEVSGVRSRPVAETVDTHLGGDACTGALAAFLQELAVALHGEEVRTDLGFQAGLWQGAEVTKRHLTDHESTELKVLNLDDPQGPPALEMELTRDKLNELAEPLVEEATRRVARLLGEHGLLPVDLDRLVLCGGAAVMPVIARVLASRLRLEPVHLDDLDPSEQALLRYALAAGGRGAGRTAMPAPEAIDPPVVRDAPSTQSLPEPEPPLAGPPVPEPLPEDVEKTLGALEKRAAHWRGKLHPSDRCRVDELLKAVQSARADSDPEAATAQAEELDDLLFTIVGSE